MTEFWDDDLAGSHFERVSLQGAHMRTVDLSGTQFRGVAFNECRMRGVELVDVEICGELQNVVVNGVDIAPLVEAELDRRMPDRARMRPDDSDGFREAWGILERLWAGTVARAGPSPRRSSIAASTTSGPSSRPYGTSTSRAPPGWVG